MRSMKAQHLSVTEEEKECLYGHTEEVVIIVYNICHFNLAATLTGRWMIKEEV